MQKWIPHLFLGLSSDSAPGITVFDAFKVPSISMMREYTEAETERTIKVSRVYRVEDAMETIYCKYNKTPM